MKSAIKIFQDLLNQIRSENLYKEERTILTPQGARINSLVGGDVINFCSNNYLGLANDQALISSAKNALDDHGFGMASVRFICGTHKIHKELENCISDYFNKDDTILYSSCYDANGGLFETLLTEEDAVISDALNHASIIDGIRLCKAQRYRYANNDIADLEEKLKEAQSCRIKLIVTDGVFSMDGILAKLDEIVSMAEAYDALLMVDDSHATGFVGKTGRGSGEYYGVLDKIDIITSTLGKALGGASGGFTTGKKEIIELLRQRSRPYLFSNTLAPSIVCASYDAFKKISKTTDLRDKLMENTEYYRREIKHLGFEIIEGIHPIVPVMLYDADLAQKMANELLLEGIYVVGFFYPVVPRGKARIRVQISAAHESEHMIKAIQAFKKVGKRLSVI